MQMHDILGGDKQLVQELLHDMKQEAASQKQAAASAALPAPSTHAGTPSFSLTHLRKLSSL